MGKSSRQEPGLSEQGRAAQSKLPPAHCRPLLGSCSRRPRQLKSSPPPTFSKNHTQEGKKYHRPFQ